MNQHRNHADDDGQAGDSRMGCGGGRVIAQEVIFNLLTLILSCGFMDAYYRLETDE